LKDKLESNGSVPKNPVERSPRQCMAPEFASPRKVWVVKGPFMGWKSTGLLLPLIGERPVCPISMARESTPPRLIGIGLLVTALSGLPRSHARSSMSPKMWQLAQDASPLPENRVASYNIGRPSITESGSGLGMGNPATSRLVFRLMTFTELSKRVMA